MCMSSAYFYYVRRSWKISCFMCVALDFFTYSPMFFGNENGKGKQK